MPATVRPAVCLSVVIMIATLCFACQDRGPLRIGFLGELTGRSAGLGTSGRNGFLLAIEQANANGGILGRPIEAVIKNNAFDQQAAIQAVNELAHEKVVAIIGPMTSQMAIAVVPEINRMRLPMISPTASTNLLTGLDDFFLRVYYSNAQAAALLADHLAADPGLKRVAVIYDLGNRAYTEDWLRIFRDRYQAQGGTVAAAIPFEVRDDTLFSSLAEQLLATQPDGIVLLASAIDSATLCQQIVKRDARLPLFATGWSYSDDLLHFGGRSVEGLTLVESANPDSPHPACQSFRDTYWQRFHETPGFPALHAYDATRILLAALARGGADGSALRQSLLNSPPTVGAQGEIAFDRYGDLHHPALHLVRIENGRFKHL